MSSSGRIEKILGHWTLPNRMAGYWLIEKSGAEKERVEEDDYKDAEDKAKFLAYKNSIGKKWDGEDADWEVDEILHHGRRGGKKMWFVVSWKGWDDVKWNSHMTEAQVRKGAPHLLNAYKDRHGL